MIESTNFLPLERFPPLLELQYVPISWWMSVWFIEVTTPVTTVTGDRQLLIP